MLSELRRYPRALMLSVLFHVGLLILIFVNIEFDNSDKLLKQGDRVKTVKATVVDQQQLDASKRKKQAEIDKKKKAEQAEKERKAEAEKKKREEAARRKADAEKKKQAEQNRKAEAKRKADEKKKAEALKKKQAEAKKKEDEKKLAEEKRKAEEKLKEEERKAAEEKRIAQEKQKAEEKRKAEEKKKVEAEKRRLADEEQKRKQAELKAQLEAEETQRRLDSLRDAYRLAIKQKIERNWRQPQESGRMPDCEVRVLQGPGGIILDVTFGNCPGGTNTYRASIENAVYKAEPLPKPGDPVLFERELIILFNPN